MAVIQFVAALGSCHSGPCLRELWKFLDRSWSIASGHATLSGPVLVVCDKKKRESKPFFLTLSPTVMMPIPPPTHTHIKAVYINV
ncbi:hypothetical protein ABG768_016357, partial [Culter alburnus]